MFLIKLQSVAKLNLIKLKISLECNWATQNIAKTEINKFRMGGIFPGEFGNSR